MVLRMLIILIGSWVGISYSLGQEIDQKSLRNTARTLYQRQVLSKAGRKAFEDYLLGKGVAVFADFWEPSLTADWELTYLREADIDKVKPLHAPEEIDFFLSVELMMNKAKQGFGVGDPVQVEAGCKGLMGKIWQDLYRSEDLDPFDAVQKAKMDRQVRQLAYPLRQAEILDVRVYQDLIRRLESGYVLPGNSLFEFLHARTHYYANYPEKKAAQLAFLRQLEYCGVLSPDEYESIQSSYRPFELKNSLDILGFCGRALVLDARELPRKPAEAYKVLLYSLQGRLFPELTLSQFQVLLTQVRDEDGEPYQAEVIDVRLDENRYQQILAFDPAGFDFDPLGSPFSFSEVSEWDFKMLNDYLLDKGAKERLFVLEDRPLEPYEPLGSRLGFVLMDSQQVTVWNKSYNLFMLTSPFLSYSSLSRQEIRDKIHLLVQQDMVPNLSPQAWDSLVVGMRRDGYTDARGILEAMPGLVANVAWYQVINPEAEDATFKIVIERLAAVSRGGFRPEEVVDNMKQVLEEEDSVFTYGFRLEGLKFSGRLRVEYPYQAFDVDFVPLVNRALAETGNEGRFITLGSMGKDKWLYVTSLQEEFLKENFPDLFAWPTRRTD